MAFRDDREALRAKGEVLESEVESLREELERTKRDLEAQEAKDEKDETELARLRKEVDRLSPKTKPSAVDVERGKAKERAIVIAILVSLGTITVGAVIWANTALNDPAPVTTQRGLFGDTLPSPTPTPSEPPQNGLDAAQLGAVVTESTGEGPPVGEGCVLDAELRAGGDVGRVRLFCAEVIYDSEDSGGMETSMHEWSFVEAEEGPVDYTYSVRYRDTGMRTGRRPEIVVDTERGEIRVTRAAGTEAPAFTAVLRVEQWSTARTGAPLAAENAPQPPARAVPPPPDRCDLSGSWEGQIRTRDADGMRAALAPSQRTSTTVVRNGRLVHQQEVGSEPMWWSPMNGPSQATIALACTEGRATITAADGSWDGRFGPDGATFLGRHLDQSVAAAFWLRRLREGETSTVPSANIDVDVRAVVEQALGMRGATAAPTGVTVQ